MEVLAVIPARSGSKTVIHKNIRDLSGKPMLAYSIDHARKSKLITRIIISTDSEDYARIAKEHGCEVPFMRPSNLAEDFSTDYEVFYHVLSCLKEKERYIPDIVVQLRPTYPIRDPQDIDKMIELLVSHPDADSVRCIVPAREIAYKMWTDEGGILQPILTDIKEAYNMPRQQLPQIYYQNACIDVFRTNTVLQKHSMTGDVILGYKMKHNFDIDTEADFARAEQYLNLIQCVGKTFVFDIDGVIAKFNPKLNYQESEPNQEIIDIINLLYEKGNKIVLFTARGYETGIDWGEVTITQLKKWGVKYTDLKFGKPSADFYVDDKMLSIHDLKWFYSGEKENEHI